MGKFDLSRITKDISYAMAKHSPEILTGVGIAGMMTAAILAVRATPKALNLITDKEAEKDVNSLTPIEVFKITWKCYIPSAIVMATSIACLIGATSENLRRNAALTTAYTLSESALRNYQEKVIETIGEKKESIIKDSIAKDTVDRNPVSSKEIIIVEKGNTLFHDCISGRYFTGDIEKIKKAVHTINHKVTSYGYVSLNDFYYEIGLPDISVGDKLGWNEDSGIIEIDFSAIVTSDDKPCIVINYNVEPCEGYC